MRKLAYFFIGCIIISLIIATLFSSFPVFTVMGRGFLMSLSNGQYQQAYDMLSKDFKSRNTFDDFKLRVDELSLNRYESVNWTVENIAKDKSGATIAGTVVTKDGKQLSIEMQFIKAQGDNFLEQGWRIDGLYVKQIGIIDNSKSGLPKQLPPISP